MRQKITLFLFLLIISNDVVFGKHRNTTRDKIKQEKPADNNSKEHNRLKRSIKSESFLLKNNFQNSVNDLEKRKYYSDPKLEKDPPFWGTRGRRDSSEEYDRIFPGYRYIHFNNDNYKYTKTNYNEKREDEEELPFWGNRGRRDSFESEEALSNVGSCNRERRQEDQPFWGTRGRREEYPFWGNRGTRQESEPFWATRGRSVPLEPFRGNHVKQNTFVIDETEPYWRSSDQRKLKLKYALIKAMNNVNGNYAGIVRQTRGDNGYLINQGLKIKDRYVYKQPPNKLQYNPNMKYYMMGNELDAKESQHHTLHDDRMYAEQPHYIVVERSSRSSAEFDPFYISRGKKQNDIDSTKTMPLRRGAIEDLVKSVRNDPYYIARGKKDTVKIANMTLLGGDALDAKELLCSVLNQLLTKKEVKREISESNERDRRTILKNLALKLQMDPYFVSRGKKDTKEETTHHDKEDFIKRIVATCA